MNNIDKMIKDGTFDTLSKREKLQITRQRAKLEKMLGSIQDLTRLPAALFVVDVMKEHIAVKLIGWESCFCHCGYEFRSDKRRFRNPGKR